MDSKKQNANADTNVEDEWGTFSTNNSTITSSKAVDTKLDDFDKNDFEFDDFNVVTPTPSSDKKTPSEEDWGKFD